MTTKRYFTSDDHANLMYFQFPKLLMYGEKYKKMSADGKLFYMLCLDLIKLSMKKGWKDEYGRYYIKLSLDTIKERMNCQNTKAVNLKKELIKFELMEVTRIGQGKSDRLYILQLDYTDEDIYKANDVHEGIENDEIQNSENRRTLEPQENSGKQRTRNPESRELELHESETIKNNIIKTNSINQNIDKEDDDKRTSSAEPTEDPIDLIVSELQEQTQDDLSLRSFNSVVRKVVSKYNHGGIKKGKFRDYLVTALENKRFDLELRREKDDAKKASRKNRAKRTNTEVHEPIPFYDWLGE